MNKVLIKLYVPMLEEIYDIWIPTQKKIYNIILLLVKAINEISDGCYTPTKMPILYDKLTAEAYNLEITVKESTIRNGTELVLI